MVIVSFAARPCRFSRLVCAMGLALLVVPLASPRASGEDAEEASRLYLRDVRSVERAVDVLAGEAHRRKVGDVVLAFDTATFAPPPGRNLFRADHPFPRDLDAWLDAIQAWWTTAGIRLGVAVTHRGAAMDVGVAGWRARFRERLEGPPGGAWWEDPRFARFEPAYEWVRRVMPRGRTRRKPGLLVLIASDITPERWGGPAAGSPEPWRRKLLEVGRYWDAETIGAALARAHVALFVVAPEVRFGDEEPFATRPCLPWAARPGRPPPVIHGWWDPASGEDPYDRMLREQLDEDLKEEFPDATERKKEVERLLGAPAGGPGAGSPPPGTTAPADPKKPAEAPPDDGWRPGGRFTSGTPALFPRWGSVVPFTCDVPSGFGWWPYARAAVKCDGRYVFYPFGPSHWRDACPRDPHQVATMAPRLAREADLLRGIAGDALLHATCRAVALLIDETPWSDEELGRRASAWSAFKSIAPLRKASGYRPRRKPTNMFLVGGVDRLRSEAGRLKRLLLSYDRAARLLDAAIADASKDASPRSLADARLVRFHVRMSAFHLATLAAALDDLEARVPKGWTSASGDVQMSPLRSIKLSDCLDAYDGRTIGPAIESGTSRLLHRAGYAPAPGGRPIWEPGTVVPGQQGNLLQIDESSPDYRAKRSLDRVLAHVDPELRPRASAMVDAARDVMEHHARTPWGWCVYYAEALCYIVDPIGGWVDERPRTGEDETEPDVPWSPTPRHGSTPGGPVTPR